MRTVAARTDVEIDKVKGSKFLATIAPANDEAEAEAVVQSVRSAHRKATHVAYAWVLPDSSTRTADDGEVSGTAGPPILARLEGAGLRGVVATVTRYYGGTNLGKGGLVRAYGAAAAAAVECADVVEVVREVRRVVCCSAEAGSSILTAITRSAFTVVDARWGDDVRFVVTGPEPMEAAVEHDVLQAGRGTATWSLDEG